MVDTIAHGSEMRPDLFLSHDSGALIIDERRESRSYDRQSVWNVEISLIAVLASALVG